ncbi:MAG: hypothetical protein ABSB59_27020 [Streptosporangiaceae bacterium]
MRQTLQQGRRVLRHQAFRRFWLGMMISRAGDAFTLVALSWVVLGIAGPAQLGVVLMCFGLPRIVSGPVAGRLLDGTRPRLLLAADNAARGLLIATTVGAPLALLPSCSAWLPSPGDRTTSSSAR